MQNAARHWWCRVSRAESGLRARWLMDRVSEMDASSDYCELCDLPRSQCVHGLPPPQPREPVTAPPKPKKRLTTRARSTISDAPVTRRWTPPEAFKPLIITVLENAGGGLEADEALLALEILADDRLLPGDREATPQGELRWRYAARRARVALVDEGVMTRTKPGVWELADPGAEFS